MREPTENPPAEACATSSQTLTAEPRDAGRRLDLFLAERVPELSRSRIQELIREGRVHVDGRIAKASHRISAGEAIEIEVLPRPAPVAQPEDLPLELLHVDDDFVVVNKPAGMVVHAGAGHSSGTLVNALLHRLGNLSTTGGALRPGIVHRLDRETSGTMVVARNDKAHEHLAEAFRSRNVRKVYLALVHGKMPRDSGTIALPISRDSRRRTRMTARAAKGRHARTDWRVVARLDRATLVEVSLHTGRTHQIRAHFAAIGHPVVGDTLYGAPRALRAGSRNLPSLERNFLHAARIGFSHPSTGAWVEVRAPLPPDLRVYFEEVGASLGWRAAETESAIAPYV
ncbi:MAG TPA: RluA family pseudouridine synthase [Rhizomicrobium sp.]|nr:RluA family pseudouridine synthase [Rhizomicrobium sp.]